VEWARYRGYEPAAHHHLIIGEIESFLDSDDEVLLLFAPPGSAKSTYVSILFPSHYLARFPRNSILAATHSVEFAQRWGRRVRNDIAAHAQLLGIELAADSQASDRWALRTGGEYYGVGAGTGISGFRADLGLGDDFFGSREDAWSETVREKRWEWYRDDFSARLKPGAKRILMNTRWHEEDVAGRVLEQIKQGVVRGRVISIPAIAEADDVLGRKPGEYLWDDPDGYNYGEFLRARQRESIPMMWSALYQQRPAPEEGEYFKAAWLRPCTMVPAKDTLAIYGASDYAVTANGGDYTVHVVVGVDPDGRMYCSTSGANRRRQMNGSRRSAHWSRNGSRANGPRSRARSRLVSGRSSSACNASARRSSTAARFPRAATRRCGRNRSGGEWPCTGSTCRRTRHGLPSCDRSSCHSRPASTMTRWIVSG
jgi:hypothetical protein